MGKLGGKVAIITGATSGIGERIAEMFVAEGARVVAAGRREAEGLALEAKCGPAMSFIRTDVTDETSVKAMVDHAVARFGRLDCLVNNAGSGSPMVSITEVAAEHFSSVFDTNVRAVMFGMKHAAPIMIAQGLGSIITIALTLACAADSPGIFTVRPKLPSFICRATWPRKSAVGAFASTPFRRVALSPVSSPRLLGWTAPRQIGPLG